MSNPSKMTFPEIKSTAILALIFASRMLGLFMVIPVLALYTGIIPGATASTIGIAAGIYGLTQALFQIPCGMLSDYFGRKPVIIAGLLVFIIGSLIAAFSHSIEGLILGRAIQGVGAVGSAILALVADTTRQEIRTRAMALIGVSIGFTFILAFLLGPLLNAHVGLSGIFMLTAIMAVGGILLLIRLDAPVQKSVPLTVQSQLRLLLSHRHLWRLNLNIFILHAVLTASFLVFPHKIQQVAALESQQVWRFYLPVLVASVILVTPLLRYADKPYWQKKLISAAIIGLGLSLLLLLSSHEGVFFSAAILFFLAFNFLEASLPALVSRVVPQESKGSALGAYSFSQFLGMFAGGILGGLLQQWIGPWAIHVGCFLLVIIGWLTLSMKVRNEIWQEA